MPNEESKSLVTNDVSGQNLWIGVDHAKAGGIEVVDKQIKGEGTVTVQAFKKGEAVLKDQIPLYSICTGYPPTCKTCEMCQETDGEKCLRLDERMDRRILKGYSKLNEEKKREFLTLFDAYSAAEFEQKKQLMTPEQLRIQELAQGRLGKYDEFSRSVIGKFRTNVWGWGTIYSRMSKFNHSCSPNALGIFSTKRGKMVALRDIEHGEEVTFCYICKCDWSADFQLKSKVERGEILKQYGVWKCRCKVCGSSESEVQASDERRAKLSETYERAWLYFKAIVDGTQQTTAGTQYATTEDSHPLLLKEIQNAFLLMKEEGLISPAISFYLAITVLFIKSDQPYKVCQPWLSTALDASLLMNGASHRVTRGLIADLDAKRGPVATIPALKKTYRRWCSLRMKLGAGFVVVGALVGVLVYYFVVK